MRVHKKEIKRYEYICNWYSACEEIDMVDITPKPKWVIINEARRDIEDLRLPNRFIEQSGNSLDFARL